jgi:hypothetical protein
VITHNTVPRAHAQLKFAIASTSWVYVACYSAFLVKKVDNLDIPLTFAFLSFSTPCEPLPSFFRFLVPSETVAGPAFFLVTALFSDVNDCSKFARDLTCASSFAKLIWLVSFSHSGKLYRVHTRRMRQAPCECPVEGIVPTGRKPASFFPLCIVAFGR